MRRRQDTFQNRIPYDAKKRQNQPKSEARMTLEKMSRYLSNPTKIRGQDTSYIQIPYDARMTSK